MVKDDLLLALASRRPKDVKDLERLPSCDARQAARDGAVWLRLLEAAAERPEDELPARLSGKPPSPAVRELETQLRDRVREKAASLNIPPEVLASRRVLDALMRLTVGKADPRLPRELLGWRREVIGEDLLREVLAMPAASSEPPGGRSALVFPESSGSYRYLQIDLCQSISAYFAEFFKAVH